MSDLVPTERKTMAEDVFLYIVTACLVFFFAWQSVSSQRELLDIVKTESKRIPEEQAYLFEAGKIRYEFAGKVLAANAVRTNMSFLIAIILCMMGTMLVVRQVRDDVELSVKSKENVEGGLKTTLPGVMMIVLGTVIIIVCFVFRDQYSIEDKDTSFFEDPSANPGDTATKKAKPNPLDTITFHPASSQNHLDTIGK